MHPQATHIHVSAPHRWNKDGQYTRGPSCDILPIKMDPKRLMTVPDTACLKYDERMRR